MRVSTKTYKLSFHTAGLYFGRDWKDKDGGLHGRPIFGYHRDIGFFFNRQYLFTRVR